MVRLRLKQWEPGELRGSRRVLRAAEGAVPSADSPQLAISPKFNQFGAAWEHSCHVILKNVRPQS
ncbi:hypothetical protein LCGC14_1497040 [marine sediment metagenome]|uniref:Uncharacterized protein n=1 Tax=marine sediment metagenome TaxID=412755 RepID=A0A0F9JR31_9ZZZZ